jgi:signal transduction histidine kinase
VPGLAENYFPLHFTVRDTGIGLTQEQADQLFQAFTQADTSTTRRFGGTGLGLAISRSLIENMGGTLGVRSVIGEGSVFVIELEQAQADGRIESFSTSSPPQPEGFRRA